MDAFDYLYSASTGSFYVAEIHGDAVPPDAVTVSAQEHAALMDAQAAGAEIRPDASGRPEAVTVVPQTLEQWSAHAASLIVGVMDAKARERRYDSIQTAVTYRDDPNPVFAAEAQALFAWRSAVWTAAFAILAEVEAGTRPFPGEADFLAELPPLVWP